MMHLQLRDIFKIDINIFLVQVTVYVILSLRMYSVNGDKRIFLKAGLDPCEPGFS